MSTDEFHSDCPEQNDQEKMNNTCDTQMEDTQQFDGDNSEENDNYISPFQRRLCIRQGYTKIKSTKIDLAEKSAVAQRRERAENMLEMETTKAGDSEKGFPPVKVSKGEHRKISESRSISKPPLERRKSEPPAYEEANKYQTVDEYKIDDSEQTECKTLLTQPNTESSSDEEGHHINGKESYNEIDAKQQTEVKSVLTRQPSGPYEIPDDEIMSREDQCKLINSVKHLQEEQHRLRAQFQEHDKHLKVLLEKQPSIRRSLRQKVQSGSFNLMNAALVNSQANGKGRTNDYHLDVQIEQLYANFSRMHLVANNDLQWLATLRKPSIGLRSKEDSGITSESFRSQETFSGYWEISSVEENMSLRRENEELKKKILELEGQLNRRIWNMQSEPHYKNMPVIVPADPTKQRRRHGLANLFNIPEESSTLNTPADNKQSSTVVAGRPVKSQPGISSVVAAEMTFEWCISDYKKKFQMEQKGQDVKTESNPFYISHCGYLAQLEVYLNGNSFGRDKSLSVFLRIIKGNFDHLLHWPVCLCFSIELIDQVERRQQSLKGDSHGSTEYEFCQPKGCSDYEIWGFVELVAHSMIIQRNYIKNDSILLEIKMKVM